MLIYWASIFKAVKDHVSCLISAKYLREIWWSICCFIPPSTPVSWREGICVWCWYFHHRQQTVFTAALFLDWFRGSFVHKVERHMVSEKLKLIGLLVNRNAVCHLIDIRFAYPIELFSLPSDTTSLSPPLEQGIVAKFETYCTGCTCRHVLSSGRKTCGQTSDRGGRSSTSLTASVLSTARWMW